MAGGFAELYNTMIQDWNKIKHNCTWKIIHYAMPPEPQCSPPSLIMIMKPVLSWYSLLGPSSGHEERLVCCRSSTDWKQWLCQFYFWSHKVSQACSLLRVWHRPSTGMKKWELCEKILHLMLTWQLVLTWAWGSGYNNFTCIKK